MDKDSKGQRKLEDSGGEGGERYFLQLKGHRLQ